MSEYVGKRFGLDEIAASDAKGAIMLGHSRGMP
jgi:hypothetical protein